MKLQKTLSAIVLMFVGLILCESAQAQRTATATPTLAGMLVSCTTSAGVLGDGLAARSGEFFFPDGQIGDPTGARKFTMRHYRTNFFHTNVIWVSVGGKKVVSPEYQKFNDYLDKEVMPTLAPKIKKHRYSGGWSYFTQAVILFKDLAIGNDRTYTDDPFHPGRAVNHFPKRYDSDSLEAFMKQNPWKDEVRTSDSLGDRKAYEVEVFDQYRKALGLKSEAPKTEDMWKARLFLMKVAEFTALSVDETGSPVQPW